MTCVKNIKQTHKYNSNMKIYNINYNMYCYLTPRKMIPIIILNKSSAVSELMADEVLIFDSLQLHIR